MSQKQQSHNQQYHYVNSLAELPEDETTIPSNVTPIEELGISLVDEAKTLDSDEEDSEDEYTTPGADTPGADTPEELKKQFFTIINDLQKQFPNYSPLDFKRYLESDEDGIGEELNEFKRDFHTVFSDVDKSDPEYINLLIGLSSIGIDIPKDEVKAEDEVKDEGDDESEETDV